MNAATPSMSWSPFQTGAFSGAGAPLTTDRSVAASPMFPSQRRSVAGGGSHSPSVTLLGRMSSISALAGGTASLDLERALANESRSDDDLMEMTGVSAIPAVTAPVSAAKPPTIAKAEAVKPISFAEFTTKVAYLRSRRLHCTH